MARSCKQDDRIGAAMPEVSGTGAHLDPHQLRVWTSLLDTSRILDTELEAALIRDHGMTHREYEVLVRVDGAGGRLRMSTLARQIEASAALVSQTVSKLEERGWITREAAPEDRRGVDAVLSKHGRKALADAARPHAQRVHALLVEPLGASVEMVAEALGGVADHLRQHRSGTSCDDSACPMNSGA